MKSFVPILYLASIVAAVPAQKGIGKGIKYLGRVNPATLELSWPSTGVAFAFTGTTATIGVSSITGTNSAALYIDDADPLDISNVEGSIVIPTLPHGSHTIMLRKRSEAYLGSIFLSNITTDGDINLAEEKIMLPKRQIEIIGDSISVGYGIDGVFPCTNTADVENNPETYGAKAANLLDADYSVVAWSGKGLIRNYVTTTPDTSPIMPELWTRYGANDPDNSYTFPAYWKPQAVAIALGTNDFSYLATNASGQPYAARPPVNATDLTNAMVTFVTKIEKHYNKATFFLLGSPLLSDTYPTDQDAQHTTNNNALKAAIQQVTAKGIKAQFVDWPTQGSDVGCDYHPIALTNAQEGYVLARAISSALNW